MSEVYIFVGIFVHIFIDIFINVFVGMRPCCMGIFVKIFAALAY